MSWSHIHIHWLETDTLLLLYLMYINVINGSEYWVNKAQITIEKRDSRNTWIYCETFVNTHYTSVAGVMYHVEIKALMYHREMMLSLLSIQW